MSGHRLWTYLAGVVLAQSLFACNTTAGLVPSPRTPVEQLLMTQSLLRSLDQIALPLLSGESVSIQTAWLPTHADFERDQGFAEAIVTSWLAHKGAVIGEKEPTYRVHVLLHAFGLDKRDVFVGLPSIQSLFIPMALPELTVFRNLRNRGYARLSLDIFDVNGRLISAPALVEASVQHERYTLLFVFSWRSTDLIPPPL